MSKKRRNAGPKNTKIIVTDISALGLGEHQVSKEEKRIKNSIGIAIISYLFLLTACKEHINRGQSWGIFNLQEKFRIKVMTNQIRHSMNLEIEKLQRAA